MSIGIWQVVLILLIVLILFGAGKLPKVMGDVAKGVKNFKKGLADEGDEEEGEKPKPVTAESTEQAKGPVVDATVQRDEAAKG